MDWRNLDVKELFNLSLNNTKKKAIRIPDKRGINLARHEDEALRRKQMRIIIGVGVVLLLVLIKFGVVDIYVKHAKLSDQLNAVQKQHEELSEELKDYDKVLLEYRTYSMDWMDDDDEERYVSVARRKVLDMVEEKIMPHGSVVNLAITGSVMRIEITGMNLQQVSAMCAEVEKSPFVSSTVLQTAVTDAGTNSVNFDIEVRLQRDAEKED